MLADLSPVAREIKAHDGRRYDVRLRPYRTVDDKIDGVIVTFLDITERRKLQDALAACQNELAEIRR